MLTRGRVRRNHPLATVILVFLLAVSALILLTPEGWQWLAPAWAAEPGTSPESGNSGTAAQAQPLLLEATEITPLACEPEVCDGVDNDCDSDVDEDFNVGAACSVGSGACTANGVTVCAPGGASTVCNAIAPVSLSIPDGIVGAPAQNVVVPIELSDVTGKGVFSADVVLTFDPGVLQPNSVATGSLTDGPDCLLTPNLNVVGQVTISVFCSDEMTGPGSLAEITFAVVGSGGSSSLVSVASAQLNEGNPSVCTQGGSVDSCGSDNDCDGVDDDCDGPADDDYVPMATSCGSGACMGSGMLTCVGGLEQDSCVTPVSLTISDNLVATPGQNIVVPITASDVTGKSVLSADVVVAFNPLVIQPTGVAAGTLTSGPACSLTPNLGVSGQVTISIFCSTFLSGSGTIAAVTFNVVGSGGVSTTLAFASAQLNEGTPSVCPDGGSLGVCGLPGTDNDCDAVDDDCSGTADEDYAPVTTCFLPGVCAAGNTASSCVAGTESACTTGSPSGIAESVCNGADDDCDSTTDEEYAPVTACFLPGVCAAGNTASTCVAGTETACATGSPSGIAESVCNGADDDCDSTTDEEYAPVTACFLPGVCAAGNTASSCVAGTETACATGSPSGIAESVCNGADDDCDSTIDENYAPFTSCFQPGVCAAGNTASTCVAGTETACATGSPSGIAESVCNGADDDCDSTTDEDYAPVTACFLPGVCAAGNTASTCVAGTETACATGSPSGIAESVCNGADDDCDSTTDENYAPVTACFLPGVCAAGNTASTCVAGTETACATGSPSGIAESVCNGADDDCDSTIDENYAPVTACFLPGVCAAGNTASTCVAGTETACATGSPSGIAESVCNGADDDCDSTIDENYAPVTACFLPGVCAAGNTASTCVAGTETACATGSPSGIAESVCNGADDDCDSTTDENYSPVTACFLPGVCAAGNTASTCVAGTETACATGSPSGIAESVCNGADDDCDSTTDENYSPVTACFLPGVCAAGNTASTCVAGTETACATGSPSGVAESVCNGADDDCDSTIDENYAPVTACFLPGVCAAGNTASSCVAGTETACATGSPSGIAESVCNGADDDCDSTIDENYAPVTACFLPGVCAAGNTASTCVAGTETACATGTPSGIAESVCNGADDDCDSTTDENYAPVPTTCGTGTCSGSGSTTCIGGIEGDTCVPASTTLSIPSGLTAIPGDSIVVPIQVSDLTGLGVVSSDLDISYDPAILQPQLVTTGSLTGSCSVNGNMAISGRVLISVFCTSPLSGAGSLAEVTFLVVGAYGASSTLDFNSATLNEGDPSACSEGGSVGVCGSEICDGFDNDCDGFVDEDLSNISLPDGSSGVLGGTIVVPVLATNLTGLGVVSADLDISYNQAVLQPDSVSTGSLTGSCSVTGNLAIPGRVLISIFCTAPLSGSGSLAEVTFHVTGGYGTISALTFNSAVLNEGDPPTCAADGSWSVCGNEASETCDGLDNDCDGTVDDGYSAGASCVVMPGTCPPPAHIVCMPNGVSTICLNDTLLDVDHDVTVTTAIVRWLSIPGASLYDVVRGDILVLGSTGGNFTAATEVCVANDLAANSVPDPDIPLPREGFWYLMRAAQCTGGSTYDEGSLSQVGMRDAEIQLSGMQCP